MDCLKGRQAMRWAPKEDARLLELLEQGLYRYQIGEVLRRTASNIEAAGAAPFHFPEGTRADRRAAAQTGQATLLAGASCLQPCLKNADCPLKSKAILILTVRGDAAFHSTVNANPQSKRGNPNLFHKLAKCLRAVGAPHPPIPEDGRLSV